MLSIVTQVVKYLVVLLIAIYTLRCFTVFNVKSEQRQRKIYIGQNVLMLLIHLLLNIVIYMNRPTALTILFYIGQFAFFQVALFLYSNLYKNASRLLINNMFFLLMIGFCMLGRLDMELAVKQFAIAVVSVLLSLIVPVMIDKLSVLSRLGIFYGVLGMALVGSVFIFGESIYGARNWISIAGIGFQPSELAKIVFVFFAAAMLYKDTSFKRIVITTAAAAAFVCLLVAETDLGAAVIFFITYLLMLYVATRRFLWTGLGLGLGAAAAIIAAKVFSHVQRRIIAWRDPWNHYDDEGFQIAQSLFAISTGGWFGMGLFCGMPEMIPVNKSDFIFAVIAEELGGIFAICLMLVYISCFIMFINISLQLTNNFYKLLAVGLSMSYGFQLFLCVGGVIKFIPHTGVTLPLISYGGSSVLSTIIVFAVIQGLYLLKQREDGFLEQKRQEIKNGTYRQENKS